MKKKRPKPVFVAAEDTRGAGAGPSAFAGPENTVSNIFSVIRRYGQKVFFVGSAIAIVQGSYQTYMLASEGNWPVLSAMDLLKKAPSPPENEILVALLSQVSIGVAIAAFGLSVMLIASPFLQRNSN